MQKHQLKRSTFMSNITYQFDMDTEKQDLIKLLYITSSSYEGNWPSYLHSHNFTELFYVCSGNGSFLIEDQSYPIKKDDLIIVNPNVSHTEISLDDTPLKYIILGVEGLSFSFKDQKEYRIFNCAKQKNNLLFYFRTMLSEVEEKQNGYQEICVSMLNILTIHLKRITNSAFEIMVSQRPNRECARIKRYIDSNYQENISLDFLANMAHLNKYYFVHIFTRTYGLSPINYLNEKRIQVSKDLLENTDHSIAEISRLSGFSSQSYFAQSFKKNSHMTPGEYRKSVRK